MHKGLGETFSLEQSVSDPQNIVDCDMLRQYALESEVHACTCTRLQKLVLNVT